MPGPVIRRSSFRPVSLGYDFDRLLAILNDSSMQRDNNAAYQVLATLITGVQLHQKYIDSQIGAITQALTEAGIINITVNGTIQASNFSGASSGVNTGDVTLDPSGQSYLSLTDQILLASKIQGTQFEDFTAYTPTLFNDTNLTGSTAYSSQYFRLGNRVLVSGHVDVEPTAAIATDLGISLPVASNLANAGELAGVAFSPTIAGQGAAILGNAANNRAQMQWIAVDITNQPMYFIFSYRIL